MTRPIHVDDSFLALELQMGDVEKLATAFSHVAGVDERIFAAEVFGDGAHLFQARRTIKHEFALLLCPRRELFLPFRRSQFVKLGEKLLHVGSGEAGYQ